MKFSTEELIRFCEEKRDEANSIDAVNDEKKLDRWWSGVKRCCELMGDDYSKLLDGVSFRATVYLLGEPELNRLADCEARKNGLEMAKNSINIIIDDLNTFGYIHAEKNHPLKAGDKRMVNNVTVNNNQMMNNIISIKDYNPEVGKIIQELQNELSKKEKNKKIITELLEKLAEKGMDILEKLFLNSIGL